MIQGFEDFQKLGRDNMDVAMKSMSVLSKGMQQIAAETADYTKKSFEDGTATFEQLMGAKSVDKAFEIQSGYMKTAYEGMVNQMTKLGEMYTETAKEAYKPIEDAIAVKK